jgi:hypothetical protein
MIVTFDEILFLKQVMVLGAVISVWLVSRWIEKRLGCKNDWELMALGWRKIKLLWQTGPKQSD